jgi:hypothetical protein
VALDLAVERVPARFTKVGHALRMAVGAYVQARSDRAPDGHTWEEWLQHSRIELNAFTSVELIEWLNGKMEEAGDGKVIPPDDILQDEFGERVRDRAAEAVAAILDGRLAEQVFAIEAEQDRATADIRAEIDRITADLRQQLAEVSEPFWQRIEEARAEAAEIDCEAAVHLAIARITPEAGNLRAAIAEAFSEKPILHWSDALYAIADQTEVAVDLQILTAHHRPHLGRESLSRRRAPDLADRLRRSVLRRCRQGTDRAFPRTARRGALAIPRWRVHRPCRNRSADRGRAQVLAQVQRASDREGPQTAGNRRDIRAPDWEDRHALRCADRKPLQ